jgi:hypothetical protein
MIRRALEAILGFFNFGGGWCGGCSDDDCDDCRTEWPRCRDAFDEPDPR